MQRRTAASRRCLRCLLCHARPCARPRAMTGPGRHCCRQEHDQPSMATCPLARWTQPARLSRSRHRHRRRLQGRYCPGDGRPIHGRAAAAARLPVSPQVHQPMVQPLHRRHLRLKQVATAGASTTVATLLPVRPHLSHYRHVAGIALRYLLQAAAPSRRGVLPALRHVAAPPAASPRRPHNWAAAAQATVVRPRLSRRCWGARRAASEGPSFRQAAPRRPRPLPCAARQSLPRPHSKRHTGSAHYVTATGISFPCLFVF